MAHGIHDRGDALMHFDFRNRPAHIRAAGRRDVRTARACAPTRTDESITAGALGRGAWCRLRVGHAPDGVKIVEASIKNYTNPGGWTVSAPFQVVP